MFMCGFVHLLHMYIHKLCRLLLHLNIYTNYILYDFCNLFLLILYSLKLSMFMHVNQAYLFNYQIIFHYINKP